VPAFFFPEQTPTKFKILATPHSRCGVAEEISHIANRNRLERLKMRKTMMKTSISSKNNTAAANAALLRAVQKKYLRAVCRALDHGASPNARNGHSVPCFFAAARRECWPIVSALLSQSVETDYLGVWLACKKPILHLLAYAGQVDLISQLIEGSNVDVNARDAYGRTALHEAASGNSYAAVKALLAHGANPLLASDPSCPDGPDFYPIRSVQKDLPGSLEILNVLGCAMKRRAISVPTRARDVKPRQRQSGAPIHSISATQPDLMQQWVAEGMPKFLASVNLRPAAERSINKKTGVPGKPKVKTSIEPAGYAVATKKEEGEAA
jgi:hypothetical protein